MAVPKAPLETLAVQTDANMETNTDVGQQAKDLYGGIKNFNNQLLKI